jgi:histidinol-phosphatase
VSLRDLRDLGLELADVADGLTLGGFLAAGSVRTKADGTVVTAVDEAVEAALRRRILAEHPDHRVLGEEDGVSGGDPEAPLWVIDPIDATTNFVRGNPIFATLIGVVVDGVDAVGVVSAPALGSRWDGTSEDGARQDGRTVRVSRTGDLADAEVAFGDPRALEEVRPGLMVDLMRRTQRQRAYGDFWNYCLVASGSTDAVVEGRLSHWDLCACRAVVLAAGGRVTDLEGADRSDGRSAVATNGALHGAVMARADAHRGPTPDRAGAGEDGGAP